MANDKSGESPLVEGMTAHGKYFRLEVPNFNDASKGEEAMTSYLHLGAVRDLALAASPTAPKATGEDLAARITSFIDDTRKRDAGGSECPDFVPESVRQAETARLHTKGGWRDHSDGNRVTTTRGDKVEIIQGNYRMLVLGRKDDEAGVDMSGGHVSQSGITFAGSSSIEWTQNYDGTWKVTESTVKGDVYTTYMGDTHDWYYGNVRSSVTGTEAPSETKPNPTITDRTWAKTIASYTGSAALPVPSVSSETWASSITSKTVASTMSDTTQASSMTSSTTCPSITSTTIGSTVDTQIGSSTSTTVGAQTSVLVGNMAQITVGGTENVTLGGVLDVSIAARVEVNASTGVSLTVGGLEELTALKEHVSEAMNELALVKQCVGALYEDLHAMIMLG